MLHNIQKNIVKNSGDIKSIEKRTIFNASGSLNLIACCLKKSAKKRAGELITNTLMKRKEFYSFHVHMNTYFKTSKFIDKIFFLIYI